MAEFDTVEYKGEEIHQLDLRDDGPSNEDEVLDAIEEMKENVTSQPEESVLALTLVEGTNYNKNILNALKELTSEDEPYVEKSALVGVGGLQKVALQAVQRFSGRGFKQFDDIEDGKEYLVE